MTRKHALLLTATITPLSGIPALARTDPKLRLGDYLRSFEFYLGLLGDVFDCIVLAENSGHSLEPFSEMASRRGVSSRVELISFEGLDFPPSYGRGYGEFKMVDHACQESRLIIGMADDDLIWKCTGRYLVRNIRDLVRGSPKECDLYCHMRNYPYRLCELYLLAWNRKAYNAVIQGIYPGLTNDLVEGKHTTEEVTFRRCVEGVAEKLRVVPRFKNVPLIDGIRGWNNSHYSNKGWHPKIVARRIAAIAFPWLWI